MHVLHVGKYFPPYAGGIENFMADLLPALHGRGVKVSALVHEPFRIKLAGGHPQQAFDYLQHLQRVPSYGQLAYAPISPGFGLALQRQLKQLQPDILHLHMPNVSTFWVLASPLARRIPWVLHWHADVSGPGLDRMLQRLYPFYKPFEQALLRHAHAVIATSPDYLHSSPALAGWRSKCQVIPLGLDPSRLQASCAAAADPGVWQQNGSLRVLALGRLTGYKGFALLIQALKYVQHAELVIAGAGRQRDRLQQIIRDLGLQSRVFLAGSVSSAQRNSLLAGCDVLCLPSLNRAEAFGLVLLEAMALAKPVISADVNGSGMAWVVDDKCTGRLFTAGDEQGLAALLLELQDADLRQQLGSNASAKFVAQFHIDAIAGRTEELYQQVLA